MTSLLNKINESLTPFLIQFWVCVLVLNDFNNIQRNKLILNVLQTFETFDIFFALICVWWTNFGKAYISWKLNQNWKMLSEWVSSVLTLNVLFSSSFLYNERFFFLFCFMYELYINTFRNISIAINEYKYKSCWFGMNTFSDYRLWLLLLIIDMYYCSLICFALLFHM